MILQIAKIRKLYYQDGLSASEIAKDSGVSVWQVIKFMKKNDLPRRLSHESNSLRFERQKPSFKLKRTLTLKEEKLTIAASMLYWAEGVKSGNGNVVDFPNSDTKMILIFLKFLRKVCGVDEKKLRILLYCYANQSSENLINYWSKVTKISRKQFQKPYVRKDYKSNGRKMIYGLVHIRYNDKKLFRQINEWIDFYRDL